MQKISGSDLSNFIDRIEVCERNKSEIQSYIKDIYKEAAHAGFDVKIIRQIIKLRKMEDGDLREYEMLLLSYKKAMNMDLFESEHVTTIDVDANTSDVLSGQLQ